VLGTSTRRDSTRIAICSAEFFALRGESGPRCHQKRAPMRLAAAMSRSIIARSGRRFPFGPPGVWGDGRREDRGRVPRCAFFHLFAEGEGDRGVRSPRQIHLLKQRLKPRLLPQRREQERPPAPQISRPTYGLVRPAPGNPSPGRTRRVRCRQRPGDRGEDEIAWPTIAIEMAQDLPSLSSVLILRVYAPRPGRAAPGRALLTGERGTA
jgi:hypothetical protein